METEALGGWLHCISCDETERNGVWCTAHDIFFIQSWTLIHGTMKRCFPHLGTIFLLQFTKPRNSLIDMLEVYFYGDSKSYQGDHQD